MSELPKKLLNAAIAARKLAYAPFSEYRVGVAVTDETGKIYTGCNIENASYGASMCAERVAIFKLISEGGKQLNALVVATEDGGAPCGMCLQVIREFVSDPGQLHIYCADTAGRAAVYTLNELLPVEFNLGRERK